MQLSKKSYNRVKQTVHCEIGSNVKNFEGKDSVTFQHKVWNPGRLQLIRNDDSKAQGQLQTKVWDPGRQRLKLHDQEVMISFLLWESDAGAFPLN